jgi:hypothetical protein
VPIALDRADRRTLLGAAGLLLVVVVVTLMVAPSAADRSEQPTTYSTGSKGAKAAWLLLRESGYQVERWQRPLRLLPNSRATLVLAEPTGVPDAEDLERLRTFIAGGGRVVATGPLGGSFVPEGTVEPRPWITVWQRVPAVSMSAITRAAPDITIAPQAFWSAAGSATVLYADGPGAVVTRYAYGLGEVIWWASASPLTNAGLREPGNVEFLLACLGPPGERPVIWDEYLHGYGEAVGAGTGSLAFGWLALQGILRAVAVLLTFSRRSGPVVEPAADARLSPLEFVQTLGGLYQNAGAAAVAVDICHQRFRYRLTRRLGAPAGLGARDLARLLRDRGRFEDPGFVPTLLACEAARENPRLRARDALRLVQALFRYARTLKLFAERTTEDRRR